MIGKTFSVEHVDLVRRSSLQFNYTWRCTVRFFKELTIHNHPGCVLLVTADLATWKQQTR